MPKLHFFDTGLVAWLLGIRSAMQLRSHPLRGAIFETWVASEILKQRVHRGEPHGLFYYRDLHGAEADLVVTSGDSITLVEAKSGATVSTDMLEMLRKISPALGSRVVPTSILVYGGEAKQNRSDVTVVPRTQIHDRRW
jgi:predicted AAA+ superfamily ATPase